MKKLIRLVVLVAILGVVALFTCPDKSDFKDFVGKKVEDQLKKQQEGDSSLLQELINPVLVSGAAIIAAEMADEEDYHVCKVFTVRYKREDYKYVGIFTTFLPLQIKTPLDAMN